MTARLAVVAAVLLAAATLIPSSTTASASCPRSAADTIRFAVRSNGRVMGYWRARVAVSYRAGAVCSGRVRGWFSRVRSTTWRVSSSRWTFQRWNGVDYVYGPPYDYATFRNVGRLVRRRDGRRCRFISLFVIDAYGYIGSVVYPDRKLRVCETPA